MTRNSTLAWHFVGDTLRGGRDIPADGKRLTVKPPIVLCERGLHGSTRAIDALKYAPGNIICRTKHTGTIIHDDDKLASSARTILWRIDGAPLLRLFARQCAMDVIHLWEAPQIVLDYLNSGNETIRAAAWAAAWAVARDAWVVARDAASADSAASNAASAAWAAARDVAWAAAWGAAWNATNAAAWAAAITTQNTRLETLINEAHREMDIIQ